MPFKLEKCVTGITQLDHKLDYYANFPYKYVPVSYGDYRERFFITIDTGEATKAGVMDHIVNMSGEKHAEVVASLNLYLSKMFKTFNEKVSTHFVISGHFKMNEETKSIVSEKINQTLFLCIHILKSISLHQQRE